jgi:7-cyano-7-deazaguanine synthase
MQKKNMSKSLVLFSGGIDSTTALYWAQSCSDEVFAFTVDYGQKHKIEIESSKKITEGLKIPHKIIRIDLTQIGGSSLTDKKIDLPVFEHASRTKKGIPNTYVPFRNGILLALAAAWGDVIGIDSIIVGFNVIDSPNYPDTRQSFVRAMEKAVNIGTRTSSSGRKIHVKAPFIRMKKSEIIKKGLSLGTDYSFSISCYAGSEIPCGECSSCLLRQRAWEDIGEKDHLLQRLEQEGQI